MSNPTQTNRLPEAGEAVASVARLETLDGAQSFEFLVNPETIRWESRGTYVGLPVLNTAQPLVRYRHSSQKIDLGRVLFWTPGNSRDLSVELATLTAWTLPQGDLMEPPILRFTWGETRVERCYLEAFPYEVIQWRSGKPTQASGSVSLLLAPEAPEPVEEPPELGLSPREVEEYTEKAGEAIGRSAAIQTALGLTLGQLPTVAPDGSLAYQGRSLGHLREILDLPAGLGGLGRSPG